MSDKQVTKNAGDADATKPPPPAIPQRAADALTHATLAITKTSVDDAAKDVLGDLQKALASLAKSPPRAIPDKDLTDPAVVPAYHDYKLAYATADNRYHNARSAAAAQLDSDLSTWTQAQSQHEHAMGAAQVAMTAAVKAATDDYDLKYNRDSHSRRLNLFFKKQEAVAAALQQYETDANLAAGTLATAAGTLLGAYATFVGSLGTASGNLLADRATADQEYWQAVELIIDAV